MNNFRLKKIGQFFVVPFLSAIVVSCAPVAGLSPSGQITSSTFSSPGATAVGGSASATSNRINSTSPQNVPALHRSAQAQNGQTPAPPIHSATSWKLTLLGDPAVTATPQIAGQPGQSTPLQPSSSSEESEDCPPATEQPDANVPEGTSAEPAAPTAPGGCNSATQPGGATATTTPPDGNEDTGQTAPTPPGTTPTPVTATENQDQEPTAPPPDETPPQGDGNTDTTATQPASAPTPDDQATLSSLSQGLGAIQSQVNVNSPESPATVPPATDETQTDAPAPPDGTQQSVENNGTTANTSTAAPSVDAGTMSSLSQGLSAVQSAANASPPANASPAVNAPSEADNNQSPPSQNEATTENPPSTDASNTAPVPAQPGVASSNDNSQSNSNSDSSGISGPCQDAVSQANDQLVQIVQGESNGTVTICDGAQQMATIDQNLLNFAQTECPTAVVQQAQSDYSVVQTTESSACAMQVHGQ